MKAGYTIKASELHGIKENSAAILEMQKSFRFPRIIPREHKSIAKIRRLEFSQALHKIASVVGHEIFSSPVPVIASNLSGGRFNAS